MTFAANGLVPAFEAWSELGFMWWTDATGDGLLEVLKPDYFATMC